MAEEIFCTYCQAKLVTKASKLQYCEVFKRNLQWWHLECPKGCFCTRKYPTEAAAIRRAKGTLKGYADVIQRAIKTPLPLFSQEAHTPIKKEIKHDPTSN